MLLMFNRCIRNMRLLFNRRKRNCSSKWRKPTIPKCKDELDVARSNHQQERDELERPADDLLRQVESAKLLAEKANEANPAAEEASTTDEIQQLTETPTLQNEMHETAGTKGDQIYQHESTIRALEARLNSDLGAYSAVDIRTQKRKLLNCANPTS
jgi:hypothetical protein